MIESLTRLIEGKNIELCDPNRERNNHLNCTFTRNGGLELEFIGYVRPTPKPAEGKPKAPGHVRTFLKIQDKLFNVRALLERTRVALTHIKYKQAVERYVRSEISQRTARRNVDLAGVEAETKPFLNSLDPNIAVKVVLRKTVSPKNRDAFLDSWGEHVKKLGELGISASRNMT